jgi:hypothetical protein
MTNSYPEPLDASHDLLITINQKIDQILNIVSNTNNRLVVAEETTPKPRKAAWLKETKTLVPEDWRERLFRGLQKIPPKTAFKMPELIKLLPELRSCSRLKAMKYLISIGVEVWAKPANGSYLNGPGAMRWLNEAECAQWLTWRKRSIPYRDALKFRHHFTAKDFITASIDDDLI